MSGYWTYGPRFSPINGHAFACMEDSRKERKADKCVHVCVALRLTSKKKCFTDLSAMIGPWADSLLFWEDVEVGFSALLYLMAQVVIKWPLHRTKDPLIKIKQWRKTSKVSEQSGKGLSIFYSPVFLSNILSASFIYSAISEKKKMECTLLCRKP